MVNEEGEEEEEEGEEEEKEEGEEEEGGGSSLDVRDPHTTLQYLVQFGLIEQLRMAGFV